MELFEQRGGLEDKIGEHRATDIPAELGWERMSAGILAGVAERRKRRRVAFWLWWTTGAAALAVVWTLWFISQRVELGCFPVGSLNIASREEVEICEPQVARSTSKKKLPGIIPMTNETITFSNHNQTVATERVPFFDKNKSVSINKDHLLPSTPTLVESALQLTENLDDNSITTVANLAEMEIHLLPTLPFLVENTSKEVLTNPSKCPEFQHIAKWQIEITGYTNSFQSNYRSQESGAATPAAYETPLLGWQTGIRLRRKLSEHWRLSTGVQWQQLRYRSNFNERETVNLYRPGTIDTIFINQFTGEKTYVYRDSVPGVRSRHFQHYNKHNALQIPLLFGYEMDGGRWSVAMQAGVNLQVYHQSRGRMAIATKEIIELNGDDFYNSSFRLSYLLESQLQYQLTQYSRVFTRIGLEYHSTNWLQTQLGITQRPNVMYVGTGISWDIK